MKPRGEGLFGGRVALVTGAAKGIGWAVAQELVDGGAFIGLVDMDAEALHDAAASLPPGAACEVVADVADEAQVQSAVAQVAAAGGGIDIVCNNAAIQRPGSLEGVERATWDAVIGVDLTSVFLVMKAAFPWLRDSSAAAVVNVASVDGLVGEGGVAPYSAAKAGVVNLTRATALDWARHGIRVNAVCPGMTDTPMLRSFIGRGDDAADFLEERLRRVPLGRLVEPREVAAAVAFLASSAAAAVTGTTLAVDAGLTAGWDYEAPR